MNSFEMQINRKALPNAIRPDFKIVGAMALRVEIDKKVEERLVSLIFQAYKLIIGKNKIGKINIKKKE